MAIGAALAPLIGGGLEALGVGSGVAGAVAPVIGGAGLGAATGALTGQGPLGGALTGGLGGLGGEVGGALGGTLGLGPQLGGVLGAGLGGIAGSELTGGNPLLGGLEGVGFGAPSLGGAGGFGTMGAGLGTPVAATDPGAGAVPSLGGGQITGDIAAGGQNYTAPGGISAVQSAPLGDIGGTTGGSGGNTAPLGGFGEVGAQGSIGPTGPMGAAGLPIGNASQMPGGFATGGAADPAAGATVGALPDVGADLGISGTSTAPGAFPSGADGDGGGGGFTLSSPGYGANPYATGGGPGISGYTVDPSTPPGFMVPGQTSPIPGSAASQAPFSTADPSGGGLFGGLLKNPGSLLSAGAGLYHLLGAKNQMNQEVAPLQNAMQNAASMQAMVTAPAASGVLPAGMEQAYDLERRQAQAAVQGQAAKTGMAGSTMERDAMINANARIDAQRAEQAQSLLSQASQYAGIEANAANALVNAKMKQDEQYSQALSTFVNGLARSMGAGTTSGGNTSTG